MLSEVPSRQGITQSSFNTSFKVAGSISALGSSIKAVHGITALDFMASRGQLHLHDSWCAGGRFFYFGLTSGAPSTCPGDQEELLTANKPCCVEPELILSLTCACFDYCASGCKAWTRGIAFTCLSCAKAQFIV